MTEIFADGIRSIAIANGVIRVDLVRLKHSAATKKLEAEAAGALLLPVGRLNEVSAQFARTLQQLEEKAASGKTEPGGNGDLEDALTNL